MFYNYIYKDLTTGRKVYSQKELKDENLELISSLRNTSFAKEEETKTEIKKK